MARSIASLLAFGSVFVGLLLAIHWLLIVWRPVSVTTTCALLVLSLYCGRRAYIDTQDAYRKLIANDVAIDRLIPRDLWPLRDLAAFFTATLNADSEVPAKAENTASVDDYIAGIVSSLLRTKRDLQIHSANPQQARAAWYGVLQMMRDDAREIEIRQKLLSSVQEGLQHDDPEIYEQARAKILQSIEALWKKANSLNQNLEEIRIAKLPRPDATMLAKIMGTTTDAFASDTLPPEVQKLKTDIGENIAYVLSRRASTLLDEDTYKVIAARDRYVSNAQQQYNWRMAFDPDGAAKAFLADLTTINDGILVERRKIETDVLDAGAADSAFYAERFPKRATPPQ